MKKIFSLIIALTLLVSVFALSTVAFAEEGDDEGSTTPAAPTHATVEVKDDTDGAGNKYLLSKVTGDFLNDKDMLNTDGKFVGWLTSSADVKAVFTNIVFAFEGETDYDPDKKNDTVRLEYCTGDPRYEKNWKYETGSETASDDSNKSTLVVGKDGTAFKLNLSGYVAFRYCAIYKETEDATEDTKVYTDHFVVYVVDTTAPVVKASSSLTSKVTSGLTVGSAYTVSTSSVDVTDSSTTSTTYVISKRINGEYVKVYSSVDGLSEDYEGKDIANGTITPTADDVLTDATYKVEFTVTDANGYKSAPISVEFKVNAKAVDTEEKEKVDVIKIVLYIVAGLSAAGIVVLLFIKPKQQAPARVVYTETPASDDANQDEE